MVKNGLYSAHFSSPLGNGSGVVVVNGDQFRGGDAGIAYVGTISEQEGKLYADLRTFRHTQVSGGGSVLGNDNAQAALVGVANGVDQFTLSDPKSGFKAVLHWLHD